MEIIIQETNEPGNDRWKMEFNSGNEKFPLEISIDHNVTKGVINYFVKHPNSQRRHDGVFTQTVQPVGKLTGVQLRAISALDQLETLMQQELAGIIRQLATMDNYGQMAAYLRSLMEDHPIAEQELDIFMKAIKSMSLFCYRELIDRGMLKAHDPDSLSNEPNQEPNDGDENFPSDSSCE